MAKSGRQTVLVIDNGPLARELARESLEAFIRASVRAIPTGKQNSMAAHNLPSVVFAVVRDAGPENLANAFARPASPGRGGDLIEESARRLDEEWGNLRAMYGDGSVRGTWVASMVAPDATVKLADTAGNVDALIGGVLGAVTFDGAVER